MVEVRRVAALDGLDGLVLPGGESTTLLNLMCDEPWFDALESFHAEGGAIFGTCAGAILLARDVRSPAQPSLGLLDASIERNGYGRQIDSFECDLDASLGPQAGTPLRAVFIRAPRFLELGPGVETLASRGDEPVMVRSGRILAATFHPELTDDTRIPAYFVNMTRAGRTVPAIARNVAGG